MVLKPGYVVLLTLLILKSSLSAHVPGSSLMNICQTLADKEK